LAAAVDELALNCRPYFNDFDPEVQPSFIAVERRDGCGVIELTIATGREHQSYVFDARTGELVGAMHWEHRCGPCGCARVAGRAHGSPLCAEARVCRLCGPSDKSPAPACEPALACGADVSTPMTTGRLFPPDAPDAGIE
jgi:hypothetical protein